MRQKALFLDRDGVINVEKEYLFRREDFEFITGALEAIRRAKEAGYLIVVITNQSGIGRGYYSEEDFARLTTWMREAMADAGAKIDGLYYCPHTPEAGCACRKPQPGMVLEAIGALDIDPERSWFVGDKEIDISTARAAGVRGAILVRSGHGVDEAATKADFVEDDLRNAVARILSVNMV